MKMELFRSTIWLFILCIILLAVTGNCQTSIESSQLVERVANDTVTGTTVGSLAKVTAAGKMIAVGTSDTNVPVYIVVGGGGVTGNAMLATSGVASCTFDLAGGTSGHYVQVSTSLGSNCHDAGATLPTSGWVIGQLTNSPGSAGTGLVLLIKGYPSAAGSAAAVLNNTANIGTSSMTLDMSAASTTAGWKPPAGAGAAPTTSGVEAFDTTSKCPVVGDGSITRNVGWCFLGTATGATVTIGPVIWTATCNEMMWHYIIKGYSGGTPVGRFLMGPGTPSTTALTTGSTLSEAIGGTAQATPTSAPSIPGIPLAVTLSRIGREGWIFVYGASGDLKSLDVTGQNGTPGVSTPPSIYKAAGVFSDLSTNLPIKQAQLTVYDTLVATSASSNTFLTGTKLEGWCRNSN